MIDFDFIFIYEIPMYIYFLTNSFWLKNLYNIFIFKAFINLFDLCQLINFYL